MASRIASEPVADKIGDTKVETIKMMPNVPNSAQDRPRAEDAINFDGLPSKNAQEIAQEIAISYNPKNPKK